MSDVGQIYDGRGGVVDAERFIVDGNQSELLSVLRDAYFSDSTVTLLTERVDTGEIEHLPVVVVQLRRSRKSNAHEILCLVQEDTNSFVANEGITILIEKDGVATITVLKG